MYLYYKNVFNQSVGCGRISHSKINITIYRYNTSSGIVEIFLKKDATNDQSKLENLGVMTTNILPIVRMITENNCQLCDEELEEIYNAY